MTTFIESDRATALTSTLRGLTAGSTRVVEASLEERQDPQGPYLVVAVVLSSPSAETWPLEEFSEIRREARRRAAQALGDAPYEMSYREQAGSAADELAPTGPGAKPSP